MWIGARNNIPVETPRTCWIRAAISNWVRCTWRTSWSGFLLKRQPSPLITEGRGMSRWLSEASGTAAWRQPTRFPLLKRNIRPQTAVYHPVPAPSTLWSVVVRGVTHMKVVKTVQEVADFKVSPERKLFSATHEEVAAGLTTDIYFVKTRKSWRRWAWLTPCPAEIFPEAAV